MNKKSKSITRTSTRLLREFSPFSRSLFLPFISAVNELSSISSGKTQSRGIDF